MKLKKIASLLLAGTMAMSMLAGCAGAQAQEPDTGDDGATDVVTNFSADLGTLLEAGEYGDTIKKMDYVTFANSTNLDNALSYAVEGVSPAAVNFDYWFSGSNKIHGILDFNHGFYQCIAVNPNEIHKEVIKQLGNGADFYAVESTGANRDYDEAFGDYKYIGKVYCGASDKCCDPDLGKEGIAVRTYVVSGDVTDRFALDKIADNVADDIAALQQFKESGGNYNYSYTVSVSKAPKTITGDHNQSAKFFAVAIERTATLRT